MSGQDLYRLPTDALLAARARALDAAAFDQLFRRHERSVYALAFTLSQSQRATERLVDSAHEHAWDALSAAPASGAKDRPFPLLALDAALTAAGVSTMERRVERIAPLPLTEAFLSMTPRSQHVLWHVDVEDSSLSVLEAALGLRTKDLGASVFAARSELRRRYLDFAAVSSAESCWLIVRQLGSYLSNGLDEPRVAEIDAHLDHCAACSSVKQICGSLSAELRSELVPALLGVASDEYVGNLGVADAQPTRSLPQTFVAPFRLIARHPKTVLRWVPVLVASVAAAVLLTNAVGGGEPSEPGTQVLSVTETATTGLASFGAASSLLDPPAPNTTGAVVNAALPDPFAPRIGDAATSTVNQESSSSAPAATTGTTSATTSTGPSGATVATTLGTTSAPTTAATTTTAITTTTATAPATTVTATTAPPATTRVTTTAPRRADLSVSSRVSGNVSRGRTFSLRITVANSGPTTADQPVLVVSTPVGATFSGEGCTGGSQATCRLPALGSGRSTEVRVDVTLPSSARDPFTLTARVSSAQTDDDQSDNTSTLRLDP